MINLIYYKVLYRVVDDVQYAPVAQLDRALGYELRGREFESLQAHHLHTSLFVYLTIKLKLN